MKISLFPECYECILKHVAEGYHAHAVLVRASKPMKGKNRTSNYVIDCERDDAQVILLIGERRCQKQASAIIRAIQGAFIKQ